MHVPSDVIESAERIISLIDTTELMNQAEGSLYMVHADNYYDLLRLAENVARFILTRRSQN